MHDRFARRMSADRIEGCRMVESRLRDSGIRGKEEEMEFDILYALQEIHTQWADVVMVTITHLGDGGIFWIVVSLVLALIPKTRRCGVTMMAAMALSFLLGNLFLKNIIARSRPCTIDSSVKLLIPFPSEYSFPSGHTLNSFTAAGVLFACYRKWGIAALCLAAVIAFSRMYLFVHFPTDILGGLVLGLFDAWITAWISHKIMNRRKQSQ